MVHYSLSLKGLKINLYQSFKEIVKEIDIKMSISIVIVKNCFIELQTEFDGIPHYTLYILYKK